MTEQSLFIVKPDAVARNLVGEVISRFERKGFKLLKLKMFTFTQAQAENFYGVHKDKPFFGELTSFITSGPVVAAIIEGNNAIATTRIMIGATKSFEAEPGSIRGDFGLSLEMNVIHGSANESDALREIKLYFSESEIINYERSVDNWIS